MDEGQQLPSPAALRRHGAAQLRAAPGAACRAERRHVRFRPRGLLGNVVPEVAAGAGVGMLRGAS